MFIIVFMPQRRMFSSDIVSSDAFLDMPSSTQALYFHLGMRADDDGFVNPKMVVRMLGSSEDELKVLVAKRFVLSFESGVIVIKHWLIHNLIRSDLYKETLYKKEKSTLGLNDNGAYTELRYGVSELRHIEPPEWLKRRKKDFRYANGTQTVPRIGKVRIVNTVESAKASSTGNLELNNEIHPMSELEEPTYEREDKPKRKSKHGNKTMAVLAYAYAKASGADLTKTINGSAWLKPLSEIYDYFDKDVDAAVKYITDSVNYYESITMRDGSKCKYSVRTIQNVADVLRLMDEAPKSNKSDIFF